MLDLYGNNECETLSVGRQPSSVGQVLMERLSSPEIIYWTVTGVVRGQGGNSESGQDK